MSDAITHRHRTVTREVVEISVPSGPGVDSDAWVVSLADGTRLTLSEGNYLQLVNVLIRAWNDARPDNPIYGG